MNKNLKKKVGEVVNKNKIKGIIFDMDNTLLRSKIDFAAMKHETYQFLVHRGILSNDINLNNQTTSTLVEAAIRTNKMTDELLKEMWEIPKKHEMIGMKDADLEPGVPEVLEKLKGTYLLVIVTNNSVDAAVTALKDNNILEYFDCVVGREMMGSLKPSPDGFLYILQQYRNILLEDWVSVGDSWIDGKASAGAGIQFISYKGDAFKMNKMGVSPIVNIVNIRELLFFRGEHNSGFKS